MAERTKYCGFIYDSNLRYSNSSFNTLWCDRTYLEFENSSMVRIPGIREELFAVPGNM
jgi:hypothetical protein